MLKKCIANNEELKQLQPKFQNVSFGLELLPGFSVGKTIDNNHLDNHWQKVEGQLRVKFKYFYKYCNKRKTYVCLRYLKRRSKMEAFVSIKAAYIFLLNDLKRIWYSRGVSKFSQEFFVVTYKAIPDYCMGMYKKMFS